MKTILISGGAGFIGSNLAVKFRETYTDLSILALDNLHRRGAEMNIPRLSQYGIDFIHGDVRNTEDLEQLPKFDLLIECSAEPSVLSGCHTSSSYCINTNLIGTINCLNAARNNNASVIFFSTNRVYPYEAINQIPFCEKESRFEWQYPVSITGVSENGISEEFSLRGTRSLYGATKLCSEILIEEFVSMYNIDAIVNRCGIIAGPWQFGKSDQGICAFWLLSHMFNKPIQYIGYGGTGKQIRDMLHIDDLFALIDKQQLMINGSNYNVYNIGGGVYSNASLCEMTSLSRRITGNTVNIYSNPSSRFADIRIYISDISKAINTFNWKPEKDIAAILKDTYKWLERYQDEIKSRLLGNS